MKTALVKHYTVKTAQILPNVTVQEAYIVQVMLIYAIVHLNQVLFSAIAKLAVIGIMN